MPGRPAGHAAMKPSTACPVADPVTAVACPVAAAAAAAAAEDEAPAPAVCPFAGLAVSMSICRTQRAMGCHAGRAYGVCLSVAGSTGSDDSSSTRTDGRAASSRSAARGTGTKMLDSHVSRGDGRCMGGMWCRGGTQPEKHVACRPAEQHKRHACCFEHLATDLASDVLMPSMQAAWPS